MQINNKNNEQIKNENVNIVIAGILVAILVVFIILFVSLFYMNKAFPKKIDTTDFSVVSNEDICIIENVKKQGNDILIQGKILKEIINYELYISIKDIDGKMNFYKTQKGENNTFYALIKNEKRDENSKIEIAYMCDNEKILIKTDRMVGDINE